MMNFLASFGSNPQKKILFSAGDLAKIMGFDDISRLIAQKNNILEFE